MQQFNRTTMTNTLGYEVIPQAIPKDLAQKAANALLKQPKRAREKYDAFEIPPVCLAVRDEFIKVALSEKDRPCFGRC
jgi:hypothetical protein